ncbi:MAG: ribosome biogenesis GTPase Der [Deltaproteobacteria bacterium]|nr:ribosome biogenesis GTPase Der [Deltaproteobacteria bacterium]
MTSIIAIVGRPNVGKSTLFNRLSRSMNSIVDDQPGVTRDRNYATVNWEGKSFIIVDTGGFDEKDDGPFSEQVRQQVIKAIEEADQILFMMDGRSGLVPADKEVADILRRYDKKTYTAVNKIDSPEKENLLHDFYSLGVETIYPLSSAHGYGLRTLMDDIAGSIPDDSGPVETENQVRVAILGKPNAGKSSLINRIVGHERMLVSEIPGTTRDSVDIKINRGDREYLLIDTAGIRRKSKVSDKIDKFSMIKAIRAIERCHIAIIMIDANEGISEQDARICGYALDRMRGVILAVNKWDLVKKEHERVKQLDLDMDRQLQFVSYAPRINISALTGERVNKIFEKIDAVYEQFDMRINTNEVNKLVEEMILKRPPPLVGSRRLKFYYATQTGTRPPTFVVFVNYPKAVHFSYERFIVNQIRSSFGLDNIPVRVIFRERKRNQK